MMEFLRGLVSSTKSGPLVFGAAKVCTERMLVLFVKSEVVEAPEEESCQVSSRCSPEEREVTSVAGALRSLDTGKLSSVS